jgi:hypothetical protein
MVIKLHNGIVLECDPEDIQKICDYNWHFNRGVSRQVLQNSKGVSIGRFLLDYNGPLEVDHKDRNPLNNKKDNLRIATRSQQMANSNPQGLRDFKGVHKIKDGRSLKNKFRAITKKNGKTIHIGYFNSAEEAAQAYDRKAKELFGEFAYLNFPEEN